MGHKAIMKIQEKTDLFRSLVSSIEEMEYVILLDVRLFNLPENAKITPDLLDIVFASGEDSCRVEGSLKECSFEDAVFDINKALGYKPGRLDLDVCDEYEHTRRKKIFWDIIAGQIALPPQKTYSHVAFHNSLFSFGTYWNFCYIFVNDQKAFAIAMGAAD